MELKNGPISVFSLIFNALKVANQAFGSALALFLIILLIFGLTLGVMVGAHFLFGPRAVFILYIPVSVLMSFLNVVFLMAVVQIVAAKIEKHGYSAWESFTGSMLPAIYFILCILLINIVFSGIFYAAILSGSLLVIAVILVILAFASLPLVFTQSILALRDEGPISALKYSWDLGTKYYFRILFVLLTTGLLFVVCGLAAGCAVKAFAPQLLLFLPYFHPSMLLLMGWKAVLVIIVAFALALYAYLFVQSVITGLFLNLDYSSRANDSRQSDVQIELNTKPTPGSNVMAEVAVTKESIKTDSMENTDKHLDQVYKAQEHLAHAIEQEEDRMPTILFDEDMARQLAATEEQMRRQQEQTAKDKDDNEPKSVKMSDKPL